MTTDTDRLEKVRATRMITVVECLSDLTWRVEIGDFIVRDDLNSREEAIEYANGLDTALALLSASPAEQGDGDLGSVGRKSVLPPTDGQGVVAPTSVLAVSSTADFYPTADDAPDGFITWTFIAPKDTPISAGVFELRFARGLTAHEIATREYDLSAPSSGTPTSPSDGEGEAERSEAQPTEHKLDSTALAEGEIARGRGASGPSKRVPWEPTAEMLEAGNSQIEEPISPTGPDGEEADWLSPAQGIWWRMMEAAPDLAPPSRGGTATVQESLTAPHHPEAGGAPDLSRIAKSLADMLTEYVQGGIDSNQNWRNGLNEIIARRLQRLLPTGGAPGREEITVAIFKRAFHLEDVATSELIQKRKQDFAPVWEHAEECADAILALFPNTRPVSGSSEDGR